MVFLKSAMATLSTNCVWLLKGLCMCQHSVEKCLGWQTWSNIRLPTFNPLHGVVEQCQNPQQSKHITKFQRHCHKHIIWSTTIDHWLLSSAQLFFQVQTPTRTALHATFTPRTRVEGSLIWPAPNRQHRPTRRMWKHIPRKGYSRFFFLGEMRDLI